MRERLGTLLVREGILSSDLLGQVLALQRQTGGRIGRMLVDLGVIDESDLSRVLAKQHRLPWMSTRSLRPDPFCLKLVPREWTVEHRILPLIQDRETLRVALADPEDRLAIQALESITGRSLELFVASEPDIRDCLARCYGSHARQEATRFTPQLEVVFTEEAPETSIPATPDVCPLIPRAALLGHPEVAQVRISPDGRHISFLGPLGDSRTVWIAPVTTPRAVRPVLKNVSLGIKDHRWAFTNRHVLCIGEDRGNERWQIHAVDVKTQRVVALTDGKLPWRVSMARRLRGVTWEHPPPDARIVRMSPSRPDEVLLEVKHRDPDHPDVYLANIATGKRRVVKWNEYFRNHLDSDFEGTSFMADDQYRLRIAVRHVRLGQVVFRRQNTMWGPLLRIPYADYLTTRLVHLDPSGQRLYLMDSRDGDRAALKVIDLKSGHLRTLASPEYADIEGVIFDARGERPQAAVEFHPQVSLELIDSAIEKDFCYLRGVARGTPILSSRSHDDRFWIVEYIDSAQPSRFYLYDRRKRRAQFLLNGRPRLSEYPLVPMYVEEIPARDGIRLPAYLSLPPWVRKDARFGERRPLYPVPMVLLVHGGPHARDYWEFSPQHQWLANRGYAVLSVNYRGSTGFGKFFANGSGSPFDPVWFEDLIDAVQWAIAQRIADPERVAIMGASYGGYAALLGVSRAAEHFACGIDLCGISNWRTHCGEDWAAAQLGGDKTVANAMIDRCSPFYQSHSIKKPLLIAHGANDPRVAPIESERLARDLLRRGRPVTYLLYPDEGHGLFGQKNRLSFCAVVEAFLAQHLGGRLESFGADLSGSSLQIRGGASWIHGLDAYWKAVKSIELCQETRSRVLSLSGRGLTELPPDIGSLTELCELHLEANRLTHLPPQIGDLHKLEVLRLDDNQLFDLPHQMRKLRRLRVLDLRHNQLSEVPAWVREVRYAKLEGNPGVTAARSWETPIQAPLA